MSDEQKKVIKKKIKLKVSSPQPAEAIEVPEVKAESPAPAPVSVPAPAPVAAAEPVKRTPPPPPPAAAPATFQRPAFNNNNRPGDDQRRFPPRQFPPQGGSRPGFQGGQGQQGAPSQNRGPAGPGGPVGPGGQPRRFEYNKYNRDNRPMPQGGQSRGPGQGGTGQGGPGGFRRPMGGPRPAGGGFAGRPGGKPGETTTAEKDQGRNKHRSPFADKAKTGADIKEKNKKREEEILLSKMEDSIRKKNRKGEAVIPDSIEIQETIKISDLAKKMSLKASEIIQKLIALGVQVTPSGEVTMVLKPPTATVYAVEVASGVASSPIFIRIYAVAFLKLVTAALSSVKASNTV